MSKPLVAAAALGRGRARMGGGEPPPPPENPAINIVYSTASDRSSPVALSAATVSGTIYVWLNNNSGISRVMFFVDPTANDAQLETWAADLSNPNPSDPGFVRGDSTVPYDLKGGTTAANPWDTSTDPAGNGRSEFTGDAAHTLKVAVRYTDDTTDLFSATFTTDNNPTAATLPQVPAGLASSTPDDFAATWTWTATPTGVGGFDDTVSYEFRYSTNTPPSDGTTVDNGTAVTRAVTGLTTGVTYYAQVRGVDADGDRSDWSAPVSATVTGGSEEPGAVTSWVQFYPAGDGVNPQHNSLLAGFTKGLWLESTAIAGTEIQYPQRPGGAWSSPEKNNTNLKNSVENLIGSTTTSDQGSIVRREINTRAQGRQRKVQLPSNGAFGSQIAAGGGTYGAMGSINFVLTQRKHSAKSWVDSAQDWEANKFYAAGTRIKRSGTWYTANSNFTSGSTFSAANLTVTDRWIKAGVSSTGPGGYTPGLPTGGGGASQAEDSVVAAGLTLSGALDAKLAELAIHLVDNRNGGLDGNGVDYGYWVQAVFMRWGWEIWGPWSSDYAGINPNLGSSTILQNVAAGQYNLALNARAKELIDAISTHDAGGYPKYEVFHPAAAYNGQPGYHEIAASSQSSPYAGTDAHAGTGGDLSYLFAEMYSHVFEVLTNEIADRCDFRGIDHLLPVMAPNMAHPGAAPDSSDDGGSTTLEDDDPYRPHELSRQVNLRVLDLIGRDKIPYLDMDFYLRNSLLSDWEVEMPELKTLLQEMSQRYLRPVASSECGWTARGNKDSAPVDRVKLAGALHAMHNPIDGLWASVPTVYVTHYLPDGNAQGKDRYRLVKAIDDVGTPNPWDTAAELWPGGQTNLSDFIGQSGDSVDWGEV